MGYSFVSLNRSKEIFFNTLASWVTNLADEILLIFSYSLQENRIWLLMQIVSLGDNLH